MNVDKLREQLKIDEGVKYEVYKDHLGYPTFGIGHLVVEGDEEMGKPVGTPVSEERVNSVFESDVISIPASSAHFCNNPSNPCNNDIAFLNSDFNKIRAAVTPIPILANWDDNPDILSALSWYLNTLPDVWDIIVPPAGPGGVPIETGIGLTLNKVLIFLNNINNPPNIPRALTATSIIL